MLKELTVQEALQLLVEVSKEENLALVEGWFWDKSINDKISNKLSGVVFDMEEKVDRWFVCGLGHFKHFAIEVPDEYRYMTQQECLDWVCLHGYKGYQVRIKDDQWRSAPHWDYANKYHFTHVSEYEYRTIQEIDGKIVYGEPQEFKVKV